MQETVMKSYRWLTLSAAIAITVLEACLFTGASASQIDSPPTDNAAGSGQALYSTYCGACHQANGDGLAGVFPPLKGSSVVNKADARKHIDIVLGGLQGARASGVTYSNAMPAFA